MHKNLIAYGSRNMSLSIVLYFIGTKKAWPPNITKEIGQEQGLPFRYIRSTMYYSDGVGYPRLIFG